MRKIYYALLGIVLCSATLSGQDYLTPVEGYKAEILFSDFSGIGPFDVYDSLIYASHGDTIRCLNLNNGLEMMNYVKPEGYGSSYSSFVTISPDGQKIWAGYTVFGNTDDRIYCIDMETGNWEMKARMPGNFDLVFWNDSILVSGLNSTNWIDPASIFALDISGSDQHLKIIEIGGYSAGLGVDAVGNLYYGTSLALGSNAIYRWDSAIISQFFTTAGVDTLFTGDATKLTDIPAGANDCEIDDGGNLVFSSNDYMADKVVGLWNGTTGDGYNFDTLAVASDPTAWLGMVKIQGKISLPEIENRIFTGSVGSPISEIHLDYLPVLLKPLADLAVFKNAADTVIDISDVFTDPDDPDSVMVFEVASNDNDALVSASFILEELVLSFTKDALGEAEIILEATSGGLTVLDTFQVIVEPGVGIKDLPLQRTAIYPNPNAGIFMISTGSTDKVQVSIYNLTGRLVYENPFYLDSQQIDISNQPSGNYLIRIGDEHDLKSRIIQKL